MFHLLFVVSSCIILPIVNVESLRSVRTSLAVSVVVEICLKVATSVRAAGRWPFKHR